jgi:hypothetical protein
VVQRPGRRGGHQQKSPGRDGVARPGVVHFLLARTPGREHMAAKKTPGTMAEVTDAVKDASSSVAHAPEEHVIQPVGEGLGVAREESAGAAQPAGRKAAARMMTRSVVAPKSGPKKATAKRAASATKPTQKPAAGAERKGPRRGASKGR